MKKQFADQMRESTASAGYRKAKAEMQKLARTFSTVRHIMIFKPNEQTIEMLTNEGFTVTKTTVKEFEQYKVEW